MKTLRIIGVPEHFNFPFRLLEQEQPFAERGIRIAWSDESRGSGQMNLALRDDEADLALLLTESFLKDFEAGNPSRMIGFHVATPLIWGIHLRADSEVDTLADLGEKRLLVSRMGSGSHLMGLVLAKREGWSPEELSFGIIGNMEGAKAAMDAGDEGIFLWEKYTTAPMVSDGTMKRIGEVPSPWPCFVMVASEKALGEFGSLLMEVRDRVYALSEQLMKDRENAAILSDRYGLEQGEVEKWLRQTRWCTAPRVSQKELEDAMATMTELGILKQPLGLELFLADGSLAIEA